MLRLIGLSRITSYVGTVALLAAVALLFSWRGAGLPPSGLWGLGMLGLTSLLLEVSKSRLRAGGGHGNLGFVVQLAAMVLFGGFWAGIITATVVLVGQVALRIQATKLAFNVAQRVLSILGAAAIYSAIGGSTPPVFLAQLGGAPFELVLRDGLAFLCAAATYFLTNSLLVSGAVAISSARSFAEVWKKSTLWVLGYDLIASNLALGVAGLYLFFDRPDGLARLVFPAVVLPIILLKHIYGKLRSVQDLYDELDSAYEKLELSVREQLLLMVKAIEARDPYTSGHSRRVSAISKAIAIDFSLSDDLVEEVESAALLHDVGKIHAEFAPLLQKEGKLTPEEWEIMKTHSAKSAELVGLFSRFRGHVQDAVRHHHERWDGKGYPDGVGAERIPLGARIIMIADTIDAMTTDRPYRKALGFEVVVAELQKHKGTQFDPRLVETTINSVSVRRLASQQELPSNEDSRRRPFYRSSPLRSYGSFFAGRKAGADA